MWQEVPSADEYSDLMMDRIAEAHESRLRALEKIEKEKLRVCKAYNKRVKAKSFQVGELVWKMILPIGTRVRRFSQWSPSWEGPYRVARVVPGNAYFVESLDGQGLTKVLNGKYLKKYFPSIWQES
jgi:hypothetical protein